MPKCKQNFACESFPKRVALAFQRQNLVLESWMPTCTQNSARESFPIKGHPGIPAPNLEFPESWMPKCKQNSPSSSHSACGLQSVKSSLHPFQRQTRFPGVLDAQMQTEFRPRVFSEKSHRPGVPAPKLSSGVLDAQMQTELRMRVFSEKSRFGVPVPDPEFSESWVPKCKQNSPSSSHSACGWQSAKSSLPPSSASRSTMVTPAGPFRSVTASVPSSCSKTALARPMSPNWWRRLQHTIQSST
jgi:hypothetical protein